MKRETKYWKPVLGKLLLKNNLFSYKLYVDKSNLLQLLVTFSTLVTCYNYCYFLKVTSYF